jgi:hypothetical protein
VWDEVVGQRVVLQNGGTRRSVSGRRGISRIGLVIRVAKGGLLLQTIPACKKVNLCDLTSSQASHYLPSTLDGAIRRLLRPPRHRVLTATHLKISKAI